jgi:quercetin dioxygenase-like cupin family protein
MEKKAIILTPDDHSESLQVIGTKVTVLASIQETSGREITIQSGEEGTGPPPHSHDWDESFYVLGGKVEFSCEGNNVMCTEGTLVHVPSGVVHAFSYGPGGGRLLEITEKGRATELFKSISEKIPPGPPDIPKIVQVLNENGVNVHLDENT